MWVHRGPARYDGQKCLADLFCENDWHTLLSLAGNSFDIVRIGIEAY